MEILKQGLPSCQTGLRTACGLGGLTGPKAVRPAEGEFGCQRPCVPWGYVFAHRMDTPATSAARRLRHGRSAATGFQSKTYRNRPGQFGTCPTRVLGSPRDRRAVRRACALISSAIDIHPMAARVGFQLASGPADSRPCSTCSMRRSGMNHTSAAPTYNACGNQDDHGARTIASR
jgi:hypothetical protein